MQQATGHLCYSRVEKRTEYHARRRAQGPSCRSPRESSNGRTLEKIGRTVLLPIVLRSQRQDFGRTDLLPSSCIVFRELLHSRKTEMAHCVFFAGLAGTNTFETSLPRTSSETESRVLSYTASYSENGVLLHARRLTSLWYHTWLARHYHAYSEYTSSTPSGGSFTYALSNVA